MEKDDLKTYCANEIQNMFRFNYKDQWVSQSVINNHDRLWVQAFNELVKAGFIERKNTPRGMQYRWVGPYPNV